MTDCACRVIVRGPLTEIRHCAAHGAGPEAIKKLALVEAECARLRADNDLLRANVTSLLAALRAGVTERRTLRAELIAMFEKVRILRDQVMR